MPSRSGTETSAATGVELTPYVLSHWQNAVTAIDLGYPAFSCWQEIQQAVNASHLQDEEAIMQASTTGDEIHDQWVTLGIVLTAARGIHGSHKPLVANTLESLSPQLRDRAASALQTGYNIAIENNIGDCNSESRKDFKNYLQEVINRLLVNAR